MATTNFVAGTLIESTWLNDADAHVYDQATGAHTAANIAVVDTGGNFTATNVEGVLAELAAGGTVTAAEVSIADAGAYFTSTHVEGALQEIGAALPVISSSLTAETLTAGTNVSSVASAGFRSTRIGSIVYFSAYLEGVTVTAANTVSIVYCTIPVASNFTNTDLATGVATGLVSAAFLATGIVEADPTNDRLTVSFLPTGTGVIQIQITGSYTIL